jgi:hypothetical protein
LAARAATAKSSTAKATPLYSIADPVQKISGFFPTRLTDSPECSISRQACYKLSTGKGMLLSSMMMRNPLEIAHTGYYSENGIK